MDNASIILDPLLPIAILWLWAVVTVGFVAFALWRGLRGWPLRAAAMATLLLAIANPSVQTEDRDPLSDIVILVVDESASQRIADRPEQTAEAIAAIEDEVADLPNTELRIVRLGDAEGNQGTLLMDALTTVMTEEPRARIAHAKPQVRELLLQGSAVHVQ